MYTNYIFNKFMPKLLKQIYAKTPLTNLCLNSLNKFIPKLLKQIYV